MYDAAFIESCFDNLVDSFNAHNSYEFLSSIYLANSEDVSYIGSLEKLVYTVGDTNEVYTRNERKFIEKIKNVIVFSPLVVQGKRSNVSCNVISVELPDFSDSIYSSIAFMKICNKALEGFNIYLLVSNEAVYLGLDDLENTNALGCKISYPIKSDIDWDKLQDAFLYVDTKNFQFYYDSLSDAIATIVDCYEDFSPLEYEHYYFDEEADKYVFLPYISFDNTMESKSLAESRSDFDDEVQYSKESLSYIKTNKVNSLELLMDAETIEQNSTEQDIPIVLQPAGNADNSLINESMLDDPEALIKLLKKKNNQGT